ncbi:hypothetical protein [Enterobacter hormaechei]|uniref:hypothetical protein n=1 Tax=Enterobacter hormaechei TaxID=158836 RepID=UPI002A761DD5|nr:hypothetical protein [Enterobacter hormaechei]MDY3572439.1 hypothetical protein [Enterobacter hormaechei]
MDVPTPHDAAVTPGEKYTTAREGLNRDEKFWVQTSGTMGTALSCYDPKQSAANVTGSMVTGAASSAVQDWLSQFGTARVEAWMIPPWICCFPSMIPLPIGYSRNRDTGIKMIAIP